MDDSGRATGMDQLATVERSGSSGTCTTPPGARSPSLDELLLSTKPALKRTLARFRVLAADAEDLMQDVFVLYLLNREQIRDPHRWMLATTRNCCLKYWRQRRMQLTDAVESTLLDLIESPNEPLADRLALRRDLQRHLATLRPRCRSLLHLRYAEGHKDLETARRFRYSPESVRKLIQRCLTALTGRWFAGQAEPTPRGATRG